MTFRFNGAKLVFHAALCLSLGVSSSYYRLQAGESAAKDENRDVLSSDWEKATRDGAFAFKESRYGDAERCFRAAVEHAAVFGKEDIRLASSLTNLGVLYDARGDWQKAEPLFARAIKIKESALGSYSVENMDSSARLCQFYLRHKRYDKADPLCRSVIELADKQISDMESMRNSYKMLDSFYGHHEEMSEARDFLLRARQLTKSKADNQCLEMAVLLDRLAKAYINRPRGGRFPECERLYKQSLALRENVLSGTHLALAESYGNLGRLYAAEKRFAIAEPLLQKSYKISYQTLGGLKPQALEAFNAWTGTLLALGRVSQCETLYRQALSIAENEYGPGSGNVADLQIALAGLLESRGQYHEAVRLLGAAVKTKEKLHGPQHASLALLLNKYSLLLDKNKQSKEAAKLQARAERIRG